MHIRDFFKPVHPIADCARAFGRNFIRNTRKGLGTVQNHLRKCISVFSESYDTVGYYTVLLLVLTALAAAAYSYRNGGFNPQITAESPQQTPEAAVAVQSQPQLQTLTETEERTFIMPVAGEIRTAFSMDKLNWSETLGMWQTHPALDIAASGGEAVLAAADGTVTEVYSDVLYGNTIVIDHGSGCIIQYASLNTLQMVEAGQKVRQGDVISAIGSNIAEAELGTHLHLECYIDGVPTDFDTLLHEN